MDEGHSSDEVDLGKARGRRDGRRRWAALWPAARWVLVVAGALIAGALAAWGLAIESRREPYPPANAFLDAWRAGDRDAMYFRVGEEWRREGGRAGFDAWLDEVEERLGPLREARLEDYRDRSGPAAPRGGRESVRLLLDGRFERGWALVGITALRQGGGGWAVEGVDVEEYGSGLAPPPSPGPRRSAGRR